MFFFHHLLCSSLIQRYVSMINFPDLNFSFFGYSACGLSPLTRNETRVPAVEAQSPNYWTTREFPRLGFSFFFLRLFYLFCCPRLCLPFPVQALQLWCLGLVALWQEGSQFSQPGIQPVSPALQGGFLTTGLPGKSQDMTFLHMQTHIFVKKNEHLMFPFLFCYLN